jgi:hypothetical protein
MANLSVDFTHKNIMCDCGHVTGMEEPDVFFQCLDCGQYHINCFGCNRTISLPQILQDYIKTYRDTLPQFKVDLKQQSWQQGFQAARDHKPNQPPPGTDPLSWYSGYIEGKQPPPTPH